MPSLVTLVKVGVIGLALAAGCRRQADDGKVNPPARDQSGHRVLSDEPLDPARTIARFPLPTNDGTNCLGIAALTKYLIERETSQPQGVMPLSSLAAAIYTWTKASADAPLVTSPTIDGTEVSFESADVLEKLARAISELYRVDYDRAMESEQRRERLIAANRAVFPTRRDLVERLKTAASRAELCTTLGTREGIDAEPRDMAHIIVVLLNQDDELMVWDPNSPREVVRADVNESELGLELSWECMFRDSGTQTRQTCLVGSVSDSFQIAFGAD